MHELNPDVIDVLKNGTQAERKYICAKEPMYFALVHFPEFFRYPLAPFHYDFVDDYKRLMAGEIDVTAWIAFRESAKTSWKKILITHAICHRLKRFTNYDSYDKENAEAALFDIANWLTTRTSLIVDYGHQIPPSRTKQGAKTIQRISKFITTWYDENGRAQEGTMVQAFSTQEPMRGRVWGERRPDWVVFDDIETNKTKESRATIKAVIDHFNEARTGLQGGVGAISVLGNLIVDDGAIGYIMEAYKANERATIRNIPVAKAGKPTWPGKYVMTNAEAVKLNAGNTDRASHFISLEQKRAELKDAVYEPEMMNNPSKSGDLFFNRRLVDAAIERAKDPLDVNAGLMVWERFNPKHRYGGGADTSEGIGSDDNSSVWIDFTVKPNLVVATFADNQMAPNTFGWELKREGALYGLPYLVPELNQSGYATLAELLNAGYPQLYRREVRNKTTQQMQNEFGWKATVGTVFEVMGDFKSAFEDGELEILDAGLLEEMKLYRRQDARRTNRERGATRHFDKLRAAALAWHARRFAPAAKDDRRDQFFNIPGQAGDYRP